MLIEWRSGKQDALPKLTSAIYQELHRLAYSAFRNESAEALIQPTALVHELYLKLPEVQSIDWQCRGQFLAVASRIMRNILVDRARRRRAGKRGQAMCVDQTDLPVRDSAHDLTVLTLHDALDRLAIRNTRQAMVVELRFFGGLTAEETVTALRAQDLECSLRTVERDWTFAKAWLHRALTGN